MRSRRSPQVSTWSLRTYRYTSSDPMEKAMKEAIYVRPKYA